MTYQRPRRRVAPADLPAVPLPLPNPALLGGVIQEVLEAGRREDGCGRPELEREEEEEDAGTRLGGRMPVAIPKGLALGATAVGR